MSDLFAVDYIQVDPEEFLSEPNLKTDLYIQKAPNQFVRLGNRGSGLSSSWVARYRKSETSWLYMRKDDFAFYVGFNVGLVKLDNQNRNLQQSATFSIIKSKIDQQILFFQKGGISNEALDYARFAMTKTITILVENSNTYKLIETMELVDKHIENSIAVCAWACLISRQMGLIGEANVFKVLLSAFFHDIGLKENTDHLLFKKRSDLSSEEERLMESHLVRGYDILNSIPGMPSEPGLVALQHHERIDGTGYPAGLDIKRIHPISLLVAVCKRLGELEIIHQEKTATFEKLFAFLMLDKEGFSAIHLTALRQLISPNKI